MHKSKQYLNFAKLFATLCIFAYAIHDINFVEAKSILKSASSTYLFTALFLIGLHLCVVAIRWREVICICGKTAPVTSIISLTLVGQFFRSILPFSIGSDIARAIFCQKIGLSRTMAFVSVIIDRILGLISLAAIVVVVSMMSESTQSIAVYGVTLSVLILTATIATIMIMSRSSALLHLNIFSALHINFNLVALSIKNKIFSKFSLNAIIYSILANLAIVLSMFFLAVSIKCDISLIQSLIYFPIVLLMALLPISIGGWGVREMVMIYVFSLLSLPATQAVFISVAFGMILSFYGFVGGIVLYKLNAILSLQK